MAEQNEWPVRQYIAQALGVGAVGAGGYLTYKSARADLPTLQSLTVNQPVRTDPLLQAQRQFSSNITRSAYADRVRQRINNLSLDFGAVGEAEQVGGIKTAYIEAMRSVETYRTELIDQANIAFPGISSRNQAISYVYDQLRHATDPSGTGLRFLSNIEAMAGHARATGQIPNFVTEQMALAGARNTLPVDVAGSSLPEGMFEDIQRLRTALGPESGWQVKRYASGDVPGSTLGIEFTGGKLGNKTLSIDVAESLAPGSIAGYGAAEEVVAVGREQQHLFKTAPVDVLDPLTIQRKTTLTHQQAYLRQLVDALIPEMADAQRKSQSSINHLVNRFHQEYFKEEWLTGMTSRGGQYQPSPGQLRLLRARQGERTLAIEGPTGLQMGRQIEDLTYDRILQSGAYTAETSPSQMKQGKYRLASAPSHQGVFATALDDPARRTASQMLAHTATGPSPGAAAFNRQFHVNTRTSTQEHLARLLGRSAEAMGIDIDQLVPVRATVFHPETEAGRALRPYGLFDEAGRYISEHAPAYERVSPAGMFVSKPSEALAKLVSGAVSDIPAGTFSEGQMLGFGPMGEPVTVGVGTNLTQVRRTTEGLQVLGQTTESPEAFKIFGMKAMVTPMPREEATQMLKRALRDQVAEDMVTNQTQMIHVADLNKHRLIQKQLVFTALAEQVEKSRGTAFAGKINKLLTSLTAPAQDLEQANRRFMQQAWRIGKRAGLSTVQMGGVFGYVGPSIKGLLNPGAVSDPELAQIAKGGFGGTAFVTHGESLAGQTIKAGIEPRFFDILGSPILADWAPKATAELVDRIKLSNPNYPLEQEVSQSIRGILSPDPIAGPAGTERINIKDITSAHLSPTSPEFLPARPSGAVIQAAGREIYIPHMNPAAKLESGAPKMPDVWRTYEDYIGEMKSATPETAAAIQEKFAPRWVGAYQALQTETGGLQRSKHIPGTRILTGVGGATRRAGGALQPWEAGVNPETLGGMLREMTEMGQGFDPAEEQAMLAGKKPVPAMAFRHPATAQTSITGMHVRADPSIPKGTIGFASDLRQVSMSVAGGEARTEWIDFGLARLMRGDLDADFFGLSPTRAAADEVNSFVHHQFMGGPGISMMQEDAVRWQILEDAVWKPKRAGKTMAQAIREAGNVGRISQSRVGSISNAMSGLRAAVVSSAEMTDADKRAAMALLFTAEEFPISAGKHMGGDVEALTAMLSQPVAASKQSGSKMAESLEAMFRKQVDWKSLPEGSIARNALEGKGIDVEIAGQSRGRIADLGIGRISKAIASAHGEANRGDGISAARYRQLMSGRGQKGISALEGFQFISNPRAATALFQPEAVMASAASGPGMSRTTKVLSQINQLAAAGKKVLPHAKPLAIGLGAMLGIGAILSSPETPMKPPPQVKPNMAGSVRHRDITPESMLAQQNLGEPTPPQVVNQNRQLISPGRGAKLRVRSTMSNTADLNRLNSQLAGTSSNARIRINDNRRQMRPYEVSDMMGAT